jgi:hypothetical protein
MPHGIGEWIGFVYGIGSAVLVLGMFLTYGAAASDQYFGDSANRRKADAGG